MTRKEVRRFQTKDDDGNRHTIIEYQTFQESNEIRGDRQPAGPITGQLFETADGDFGREDY